jgi:cell division septal protein FtsQ
MAATFAKASAPKVAAPADKRFRRSRVSPVRKRSWLPHWRTVAILTAVLGFVGAGLYQAVTYALEAEALTVTRITVSGNARMSRGEVLALVAGIRGESMVTADLEAVRQKLLSSPWVADAALRRMLPGTLAVTIAEREPIGIGRIAGALYLIDERGMIIDEFGPNYSEFDLPIIDGLEASPDAEGMLVDDVRAALAGRLLSELQRHPTLARRVSQIDVSNSRDAAVILKGDTALLRVGVDRFAERIQSYVDLAPTLRERVPQIDYVDLRFDERVYVKPQGDGAGVRTANLQSTGGRE